MEKNHDARKKYSIRIRHDGVEDTFKVDKEPEWEESAGGEKIYVVTTDRSLIVYNWRNVTSYSQKEIISGKPMKDHSPNESEESDNAEN